MRLLGHKDRARIGYMMLHFSFSPFQLTMFSLCPAMRGATSTPNARADSRCCTGGKHTSTRGAKITETFEKLIPTPCKVKPCQQLVQLERVGMCRETAFFATQTKERKTACHSSRNPLQQWVGICSLHSPQTQPFHLPPGPIAMLCTIAHVFQDRWLQFAYRARGQWSVVKIGQVAYEWLPEVCKANSTFVFDGEVLLLFLWWEHCFRALEAKAKKLCISRAGHPLLQNDNENPLGPSCIRIGCWPSAWRFG